MNKINLNDLQKLRLSQEELQSKQQSSIIIGMGTCGIAAGSGEVYNTFQEELSKNNLNNSIIIKKTGCIGFCSLEPTVEIQMPGLPDTLYGDVNKDFVKEIVENHIKNKIPLTKNIIDKPDTNIKLYKKQLRIVLRNCGVINPEEINEYIARDGYKALGKVLFEMKPNDVIEELKKSGLRGRGGAGFPTWKKWTFSKDAGGDTKYIVCNADEGDPGAYMDRSTLEGDPHSILEAMAIAGFTVGAKKGFIYIRAEYPLAIKRLEIAIKQSHELGLLGDQILGSNFCFDIELRYGAGAFVCGEETALLTSIEGNRGMPKPRPPFPAAKGLWDKPTVINNVETYANIPVIILKGGDWFSQFGTATSKGTKVFALTGKIKNSGLIEVPMGTTLREIIYEIGSGIKDNKKFKAAQSGGPSGGVIPEQFLDIPIDYENLQNIGSIMGSGGLIVMSEDDCMVNVAKFYQEFTVDESCGKCAPCRIGGKQLHNFLDKISKGEGKIEDIASMKRLGYAMQKASLCGLGQTAPNPVLSTLKYFENEYLEHIKDNKCSAVKK